MFLQCPDAIRTEGRSVCRPLEQTDEPTNERRKGRTTPFNILTKMCTPISHLHFKNDENKVDSREMMAKIEHTDTNQGQDREINNHHHHQSVRWWMKMRMKCGDVLDAWLWLFLKNLLLSSAENFRFFATSLFFLRNSTCCFFFINFLDSRTHTHAQFRRGRFSIKVDKRSTPEPHPENFFASLNVQKSSFFPGLLINSSFFFSLVGHVRLCTSISREQNSTQNLIFFFLNPNLYQNVCAFMLR